MVKYSSPAKEHTVKTSGPKPYNYNVGRAGSLLTMMQSGGGFGQPQPFGKPRTPGSALLARALQKQDDLGLLEDYQREEAERQKRGGFWSSALGTIGGLAGAAIGGPAGAAIGTSIGSGVVDWAGAGKAKKYDKSGTVYAQESFEDIEEASKDYSKDALGRSLVAGAKAGLTAGLTPGGGQYGQYNPFTETGQQGIKALSMGKGVTGYTAGTGSMFDRGFFATPEYVQAEIKAPKLLDTSKYLDKIFDQPTRLPFTFQDGGLIGMQNGGPMTPESILLGQGLTATPEQLALFESFDPFGIQKATQQIGQSVTGATGGQGVASVDSSFGRSQRSLLDMLQAGQEQLQDTITTEQKAFESKTLGTAADIVSGGGRFGTVYNPPPSVPELPTSNQGSVTYNGQTYVWSEEEGGYVLE